MPGMQPTLSPEQAARRRSINKKILIGLGIAFMLLALIATLGALAGSSDTADGDGTASVAAPEYTAINKHEKAKTGQVDLLIPDSTIAQAQAAIRDYAKGINGQQEYWINVIRTKDAKVYVCAGRWIRDERASQLYTGGDVTADAWPTISMNCPNP